MTETLTVRYTIPHRDRLLHAGFVDCPYEELSGKSKYFSRGYFRIADCSLIEYIGVEWSRGMPEEEHLAYMTRVFDTLASVGNDTAALSAFQVLTQVLSYTERMLRRAKYESVADDGATIKMHPYYPSRRLEDVLSEELRHELLEFIRARFWTMPLQIPKDVLDALEWKEKREDRDHKQHTTLIETRKAMIRACARDWQGKPGDANDELAFKMLCMMANHWYGFDLSREKLWDMKVFQDIVQQELRRVLNDHIGHSGFNWKHWLTVNPHPEECAAVLETLAKTRAALGGYKGAILDIEARESIAAMMHTLP